MGGTLDLPEPSIVGGTNERSQGGTPTRGTGSRRAKGRGKEEEEEARAVGTGE